MKLQYIHQLGELFEEVQMNSILEDGKTFPDCTPKFPLDEIKKKYTQQKKTGSLDLKKFTDVNFELPLSYSGNFKSDVKRSVEKHIEKLWDVLTRKANDASSLQAEGLKSSSLIPLPFPYIVPGGRFREIYYWDSYFTMLGLQVSKRFDLIENMINNFAFLIDTIGYIPNGNRGYYLGRSQPPFFSLMVKLLSAQNGNSTFIKYLPQLEKEYRFWMNGSSSVNENKNALHRVVQMPDGSLLNRYWDENDDPRPESFKEDTELAENVKHEAVLFRHIRAAAESGWDFSSRWFKQSNDFSTIHTAEIIPVDLNCLLFHLEDTLMHAYKLSNNIEKISAYKSLAARRKEAIQKYCWNERSGFYFDYDFVASKQKQSFTLAAGFPLFFNIANQEQAEKVASLIHSKFLKDGGLVTTIKTTGQQWDAPNGWAPLQWIAIKGLENYTMFTLAAEIAKRWVQLNLKIYQRTGKLMEKYNVVDTNLEAGGGEYPAQDGFGWTNGVLLKILDQMNAY